MVRMVNVPHVRIQQSWINVAVNSPIFSQEGQNIDLTAEVEGYCYVLILTSWYQLPMNIAATAALFLEASSKEGQMVGLYGAVCGVTYCP